MVHFCELDKSNLPCVLGLFPYLGRADWDLQVGGSEQAVGGETPGGSACCPVLPALFHRCPWLQYCPTGTCLPAAGRGQHGWGGSTKWFLSSTGLLSPSYTYTMLNVWLCVCLCVYMYCIFVCLFSFPGLGNLAPVAELLSQAEWAVLKSPECGHAVHHRLHRSLGRLHTATGNLEAALLNFANDVCVIISKLTRNGFSKLSLFNFSVTVLILRVAKWIDLSHSL